jgi:hypothetical protein
MKLKVPFVRNLKRWKGNGWCGPIALASLLRYYKDRSTIEEIVRGAESSKRKGLEENSGGTSPEGLAYFCLSRGFDVDFIDKHKIFSYNRKEFSPRYKKFHKDFRSKEYSKKFHKKLKENTKYNFIKKNPTIKDIESYIKSKKPVLLYLNVAVLCNLQDKLWPHYVLIVGEDKNNFYMHNIYPKNKAYQKISKKIFKKSWESDGMNHTLIIPYK